MIDNHRLKFFYSLKGILYGKNENGCLLQVVEVCENLYVNLNWTMKFHPFSEVFPSTRYPIARFDCISILNFIYKYYIISLILNKRKPSSYHRKNIITLQDPMLSLLIIYFSLFTAGYCSQQLIQFDEVFAESSVIRLDSNLTRICPGCHGGPEYELLSVVVADKNSTVELIREINDYVSEGNNDHDMFCYLQSHFLLVSPRNASEADIWIETMLGLRADLQFDEIKIAELIYLNTEDKHGLSVSLRKRSGFMTWAYNYASHCLNGDACKSFAWELTRSSYFVYENWTRSVCRDTDGGKCCVSWSKNVWMSIGTIGYAAVDCKNSCSGNKFSCEVFGIRDDLNVCWSNRETGC